MLLGNPFVLGDESKGNLNNYPFTFLSQPGNPPSREGKSLIGTFPFSANEGNAREHHAHHEDDTAKDSAATAATSDTIRDSKQGSESNVGFNEVAEARPGRDGKRCVDKQVTVTETVYDDVVQCDHSYDKRCHTSFVTNYESQQEEECEETFKKICHITYEAIAFNETVQICRRPLVKDCKIQISECKTYYQSECWTKQEEHTVQDDVVSCNTEYDTKCDEETSGYTTSQKCSKWPKEVCSVSKEWVKKYTPITGCTKEPIELCGHGCGFREAKDDECYEKTQTVVADAPKEECSIEPQRTCKFVTKLVPKLEPKEECLDVPKEVCTRSKTNPQTIEKPVIKKWCYVPSEESGLA